MENRFDETLVMAPEGHVIQVGDVVRTVNVFATIDHPVKRVTTCYAFTTDKDAQYQSRYPREYNQNCFGPTATVQYNMTKHYVYVKPQEV